MATQMAVIVLIGVLAGKQGDAYFNLEQPYLTLVGVLFGMVAAFYLTLKDLITPNK